MNQDILLSKIVPNATELTWSQAYTTLNVYITVSIESAQTTGTVASEGKEILEKLQREFFALDEKSLENIKKAVENVAKTIQPEYEYSILVGAIVKNVLYIVIASDGIVILKRGEKVGVVAQGKKGELIGFSGRLEHDDIVSFETGGFNDKIPLSTMQEYLSANDVSQISENLTPLVHGESKGTEAAIILQYKDLDRSADTSDAEEFMPQALQPKDEKEEKEEDLTTETEPENPEEELEREDEVNANLWTKPPKTNEEMGPIEQLANEPPEKHGFSPSFPSVSFLKGVPRLLKPNNKRGIIILVAGLLIFLLIGSIAFETNRRASAERQAEFAKIYDPARTTFDEGAALENLNKSLALEKIVEAEKMVEESLSKFPEGSKEYEELAALLQQIQAKIEEIGGGGQVKNLATLTETSNELPSIDAVTVKGGALTVVSEKGKRIATLTSDGDIEETFDTEITGDRISADETYVYILGSGVERIDKGNGNADTILEESEGRAIDIFGSNFYILQGDDIEKYRAPSSTSTSYFAEKPTFEATPISFSIDGSVWVLEENGAISKFTRGERDNFEIKGLLAPFGSDSSIYTDSDYQHLYVLDSQNQRVVVLSKNGEFQNQYEWNGFENATSFAIDETNKKGYVTANNTLHSFDL